MRKRDELTDPNSCLSKARDDEWTFVLLGRDAAAPKAVEAWVKARIRMGKNKPSDPQIVEALQWIRAVKAEHPSTEQWFPILPMDELQCPMCKRVFPNVGQERRGCPECPSSAVLRAATPSPPVAGPLAGEDDGVMVDEAWLRSVGFADDRMGCPTLGSLHVKHATEKYPAYACVRSVPIPFPLTRGDVRELCRLLGITLRDPAAPASCSPETKGE